MSLDVLERDQELRQLLCNISNLPVHVVVIGDCYCRVKYCGCGVFGGLSHHPAVVAVHHQGAGVIDYLVRVMLEVVMEEH